MQTLHLGMLQGEIPDAEFADDSRLLFSSPWPRVVCMESLWLSERLMILFVDLGELMNCMVMTSGDSSPWAPSAQAFAGPDVLALVLRKVPALFGGCGVYMLGVLGVGRVINGRLLTSWRRMRRQPSFYVCFLCGKGVCHDNIGKSANNHSNCPRFCPRNGSLEILKYVRPSFHLSFWHPETRTESLKDSQSTSFLLLCEQRPNRLMMKGRAIERPHFNAIHVNWDRFYRQAVIMYQIDSNSIVDFVDFWCFSSHVFLFPLPSDHSELLPGASSVSYVSPGHRRAAGAAESAGSVERADAQGPDVRDAERSAGGATGPVCFHRVMGWWWWYVVVVQWLSVLGVWWT